MKVTTKNFEVFMKQSHDSSDDYEFPVAANQTLRKKTAIIYEVTFNACDRVRISANSGRTIFFLFLYFIVLCSDNNIIIFYAHGC